MNKISFYDLEHRITLTRLRFLRAGLIQVGVLILKIYITRNHLYFCFCNLFSRFCLPAKMKPMVMILPVFVILFPVARSTTMAVIKNITVQESLSLTCYNQAKVRSKVELGIYCGMDNSCMAVSNDVTGDYPFTRCECPTNPAIPNILPVDLASVLRVRLYGGQLRGNHNPFHPVISCGFDYMFIFEIQQILFCPFLVSKTGLIYS